MAWLIFLHLSGNLRKNFALEFMWGCRSTLALDAAEYSGFSKRMQWQVECPSWEGDDRAAFIGVDNQRLQLWHGPVFLQQLQRDRPQDSRVHRGQVCLEYWWHLFGGLWVRPWHLFRPGFRPTGTWKSSTGAGGGRRFPKLSGGRCQAAARKDRKGWVDLALPVLYAAEPGVRGWWRRNGHCRRDKWADKVQFNDDGVSQHDYHALDWARISYVFATFCHMSWWLRSVIILATGHSFASCVSPYLLMDDSRSWQKDGVGRWGSRLRPVHHMSKIP